jgi:hypothetical protein
MCFGMHVVTILGAMLLKIVTRVKLDFLSQDACKGNDLIYLVFIFSINWYIYCNKNDEYYCYVGALLYSKDLSFFE